MFTCALFLFAFVTILRKFTIIHTFLDQGSSHTFCDTKLINALNVSGESENILVNTLNGVTTHSRVKCSILPIKDDDEFISIDVISLDRISVKTDILPAKDDIAELPYLRDIDLSPLKGASVTLLIGANVPEMLLLSGYYKRMSQGFARTTHHSKNTVRLIFARAFSSILIFRKLPSKLRGQQG